MDFPELVDAVIVKTGRPDQVDAIRLALQEATLWAHLFDFWKRDLVEVPVAYDPAQFVGALDIGVYLPGHRKIAYWRKYDPLTGAVGDFLKQVEPDKLFDAYRCRKTNVFYLGGKVINWLSSTSDKGHVIGYYKAPNLAVEKYDSWIAAQFPFVLVNFASSIIFGDIGQQDESVKKRQEAMAALQQLTINEVETVAR